MEKFLIFLAALVTFQYAHGQYIPTRSERSGNGITPDGMGYVYNFGSDLEDNCYDATNQTENYNQFKNANYTCTLNTALGYFNLLMNGSQLPTDLLINHFTFGNCQLMEYRPEGKVDMSDANHQFIEARVRSSVAVDQFGFYIGVTDTDGLFFLLGDGDGNTPVSLPADEWKVIRVPAIFTRFDGLPYDPSLVIGLAMYARNANDPQPSGTVEIDYIRVGSAVSTSIASGFVSPSGNGYTFGFEGDEFHTCLSQMNVSANANFDYEVDLENNQLVIAQADASVINDLFSIEFTDNNCFLTNIDLSDESNQLIEIKISADQDVSSIGLSLMERNSDNARSYSQILTTFSLQAGIEQTISIPVSVISTADAGMNIEHINGIALWINPSSPVVRESNASTAPTHFSVSYIKVGDVAGSVTSFIPKAPTFPLFTAFPNPASEQLSVSFLQPSTYLLTLCDSRGQEVYRQYTNETSIQLSLPSLYPGIYLLKAWDGTQQYTEKIVLY